MQKSQKKIIFLAANDVVCLLWSQLSYSLQSSSEALKMYGHTHNKHTFNSVPATETLSYRMFKTIKIVVLSSMDSVRILSSQIETVKTDKYNLIEMIGHVSLTNLFY